MGEELEEKQRSQLYNKRRRGRSSERKRSGGLREEREDATDTGEKMIGRD